MSELKSCPCCGIKSGSGDNAQTKFYDLMKDYAQVACRNKDQVAIIDAAMKYLSQITLGVTSSERPNKICYESNVFDLQQATHLLNSALSLEND